MYIYMQDSNYKIHVHKYMITVVTLIVFLLPLLFLMLGKLSDLLILIGMLYILMNFCRIYDGGNKTKQNKKTKQKKKKQ